MMKNTPDIRAALMQMTKKEMEDVAFRLHLDKLRSNAKKADWAAHIETGILESPDSMLVIWPLEEWEDLWQLWGRKNRLTQEQFQADPMRPAVLLTCWLTQLGLVTVDVDGLHMHPWAKANLKLDEERRSMLELCDAAYDLMDGWLLHLGMMPDLELLERVLPLFREEENGLPEEEQRMLAFSLCHGVLTARQGKSAFFEDEEGNRWYCHCELDHPDALYTRLCEPYIMRLDYPDFPVPELIRHAHLQLPPGEESLYAPVLEWLQKRGWGEEDIWDLLYDAVMMAQNDMIDEAMQHFLTYAGPESIKAANEVCQLFQNALNAMPRWCNKGHSPSALSARRRGPKLFAGGQIPLAPIEDIPVPQPIRAAVLPGRNDPCPCGSGKKYKQCCGKRIQ